MECLVGFTDLPVLFIARVLDNVVQVFTQGCDANLDLKTNSVNFNPEKILLSNSKITLGTKITKRTK